MNAVPLQPEETVSASAGSNKWFPAPQHRGRIAGRIFFLFIVCAYFGYCYGSHPSFLKLNLYTDGREVLPYQYRILPMFLFRALMHSGAFVRAAAHVAPLHNDPYLVIMAGIGFVCLLGAMLANAGTLTRLTGDRVFSFWATMILAFMAQLDLASAWNDPFITPYDVPSLMFFSICLYLIVRRAWWIYYPVFILAVLNRETACFISVCFAVWEWVRLSQQGKPLKSRLLWILPNVAAQAVLWIAIKLWLAHHFVNNPRETGGYAGGLFITHFTYNLKELLKPFQWPLLASVCGFALPFLWMQRRWIGSRPLAASIAVVLPLSFAGLLIFGVVVEIRIFSDWIALVAPAVALILYNRLRPGPAQSF